LSIRVRGNLEIQIVTKQLEELQAHGSPLCEQSAALPQL
jgi:hypothetical protein